MTSPRPRSLAADRRRVDRSGPRSGPRSGAIATSIASILLLSGGALAADAPCSWERQLVDGNGVDLFGAADDLAGGVWVAGSSRTTSSPFRDLNFIARWTGSGWDAMDVPQPTDVGDGQRLRAIASLGADDAIAVGSAELPESLPNASPQSLRWDGSSWSLLESPTFVGGGFFADVAATGDTVWATGGKNEAVPNGPLLEPLAARLDGDDWTTVAMPLFDIVGEQTLARYRLRAVGGIAADDVWMGGRLLVVGEPIDDAVLVRWDGSDWTWFDVRSLLSSPGASSSIEAITALATDDVWAVGHEFDVAIGRERALILHWDGSAWSRVAAPDEPDRNVWLRDVVARSATDVLAVGTSVVPGAWPEGCVLHYDGVAWTRVDDVETADGSQFFAAAIAGDGTPWLAGLTNEFPVLGLVQRGIACEPECPADLDGTGTVDFDDLVTLLAAFGASDAGDVDGDGITGFDDLVGLLAAFGPCP